MKNLAVGVIFIVSLLIINNLVRSIYNLWQKQSLITNAQNELEKEKKKNRNLQRQLSQIKKPEFVEEEARDKLFLVKPGEQIVLVPQELLNATSAAKKKQKPSLPNWQQWYEKFFGNKGGARGE